MTLYSDDNPISGGLAGTSLYGGLAGTALLRSSTGTIYESYRRGADAALRAFGLDVADKLVPPRMLEHVRAIRAVADSPAIEYTRALTRNPATAYVSKLGASMRGHEHSSKLGLIMGKPLSEYVSLSPATEHSSKLGLIMGKPLSEYVSPSGGQEEPRSSLVVAKFDILIADATSAVDYEMAPPQEETAPACDQVNIIHEFRCALCHEPMTTVSSTATWIGQRLTFNADVVPFCRPCTERDQSEPGYLCDALRALLDEPEPEPSGRPALQVLDGEGTNPVPCGKVTLVPPDRRGR